MSQVPDVRGIPDDLGAPCRTDVVVICGTRFMRCDLTELDSSRTKLIGIGAELTQPNSH